MADARFHLFLVTLCFFVNMSVMVAFVVRHDMLYTVVKDSIFIRLGVLGYCVQDGPGGHCRGPPNRIAWDFGTIGSYLNDTTTNTTSVEKLQGSITPATTRALVVNLILLGISALGAILSLCSLFVKKFLSIQCFLALLSSIIGGSSLLLSCVVLAVDKVTGSKIKKQIKNAAQGPLQLQIPQTSGKGPGDKLLLFLIPIFLSLLAMSLALSCYADLQSKRDETQNDGNSIQMETRTRSR